MMGRLRLFCDAIFALRRVKQEDEEQRNAQGTDISEYCEVNKPGVIKVETTERGRYASARVPIASKESITT
jgi:hypothetical protein